MKPTPTKGDPRPRNDRPASEERPTCSHCGAAIAPVDGFSDPRKAPSPRPGRRWPHGSLDLLATTIRAHSPHLGVEEIAALFGCHPRTLLNKGKCPRFARLLELEEQKSTWELKNRQGRDIQGHAGRRRGARQARDDD